jgi:hypothetical protein
MNFDLTFEPADGHWRLFGLSVSPAPASPQPVAQKPAAPAKTPVAKTSNKK